VSTLASRSRFQLSPDQTHRCKPCGIAILCEEISAVESDTSLHANEIWAETSSEGSLYEKGTSAVEGGGCHLAIDSSVYACGVHDLSYAVLADTPESLDGVRPLPLFLNVRHSFPGTPPISKRTSVEAPRTTVPAIAAFATVATVAVAANINCQHIAL